MKSFWIVILSAISVSAYSESEYKVGLGVGIQYQGLGISAAKVDSEQLYYVGVGLQGIVGASGSYDSSYGLGVGWLTSAPFDSNHHSIGLDLRLIYNQFDRDLIRYNYNNSQWQSVDRGNEFDVGVAAQYVYHFSGIDQGGWQLSLGAGVRTGDYWSNTFGGVGVGYSF